MLPGGVTRFPAFREMNRANRVASFPMNQTARYQRFQWIIGNFIQQPVNDAAQSALRKTFCRGVNGCDTPKMDRNLLVILDDLELRVIHTDPLATQMRFAKHDHALAGRDHLLYIMQVE